MRGRRTVFAFVGVAILAALSILWLSNRRTLPISFLDGKKPPNFYFPEDLNRKPIIDVNLPVIGRVRFPKRRTILPSPATGTELPGRLGVAGYFSLGTSIDQFSYLRNGRDHEYLSTVIVSEDPRTRSDVEVLVKMPYATDEKYRDVDVHLAGKDPRRIRLPVTTEFGPSERKSASVQLGELTVHARPRPWKLTSSPVTFDLSVEGGGKREFLLQVDTIDGPNISYNTFLIKSPPPEMPYLPSSDSWANSFAQRPLKTLDGTLFEVEEIPIAIDEIPVASRLEYRIGGRLFRNVGGGQVQVESLDSRLSVVMAIGPLHIRSTTGRTRADFFPGRPRRKSPESSPLSGTE